MTGAHRCTGEIQAGQQRPLPGVADDGAGEFQVTAGGFVHHEHAGQVDGPQPFDMVQVGLLGLLDVVQQGAGRAQAGLHVVDAEASQVGQTKVLLQGGAGRGRMETGRWPRGETEIVCQGDEQGLVRGQAVLLVHQQFGGRQALQLIKHPGQTVAFRHPELAGGQVQQAYAPAGLAALDGTPTTDRGQEAVALVVQELRLHGQPRGHHPHYLPLHHPLGLGRVLGLLADRHPVAGPHQSGKIPGRGVMRHPAHGNLLAVVLMAAGGEGDTQHPGGELGVVKKHLVEVAHAIKQDGVLVLGLDLQVLLEHGGELGRLGHGRTGTS